MSRKVLIVCDAFPPNFAPRVGNLCKHLCDEFELTIVTSLINKTSWPIDIPPHKIRLLRFNLTSECGWKNHLGLVGDYLCSLSDRRLYHKAIRELKGEHFDAVYAFSYYVYPLLCARKLAHHFKAPLLIDLRDIMEQNAQSDSIIERLRQFCKLRWLNQWRRNISLRQAQAVTTVSPWHVNVLSSYNPNVHLIYNGFDAEQFSFKPIHTEKFIISYTGRLLDPSLRNPTLFLEAIHQLVADKRFADDLLIQWFVDDKSMKEVEEYTKEYQLAAYTRLSPTICSDQMPTVLNESSIVLVLSNQSTEKGPHGIMTTKFYEALGCEKPVLCVRSDEECLAQTIAQTNAGLAGRNVDEVKEFILEKYNEWKEIGYTHQNVVTEEKMKFTRQEQAQQFASLLRH